MAFVVPVTGDEEMQCPYVKAHRPLRSHFETHLVKCRKTQKDVKLVTCPLNQSHKINEPELGWHVSTCPSRSSVETYVNVLDTGVARRPENAQDHFHDEITTTENWDDVNVPTYNPAEYANNASIIRLKVGAPPSERKAFREAERRRLRDRLN